MICNHDADELLSWDTLMNTWVVRCESCNSFFGFEEDTSHLAIPRRFGHDPSRDGYLRQLLNRHSVTVRVE